MDDAFACRHPLQIPHAITTSIANAISMINKSFNCGGDCFKSSMGVLWESRDFSTVIHSIFGRRIEIASIAVLGSFHLVIPRRIIILVIDAKEIRVSSWVGCMYYQVCNEDRKEKEKAAREKPEQHFNDDKDLTPHTHSLTSSAWKWLDTQYG